MKDIGLLLHFTALIIGAGSAFALFVIGHLAANFDVAYKRNVLIKLFPLRYISYLGLLLLIISGGMLIPPFVPSLTQMPWLMAKLTLVGVLVALSVFGWYQMRRAKQSADNNAFKMLGHAGKLSFATSLVIVACAVYSFH
ncbi:MAG TPA: hypothetical protein VIU46_07170 [Gallionellaceae bacterium]